jgi:muramoyltetrapeptide carboxypeptidase LdcA involved in peptidoglycan recycling
VRLVFRYPPKPRPGDKVAVLSPGAGLPEIFPAPYELGVRRLQESYGVEVVEYPTTRTFSPPAARAADVNAAFADPEIAAILTSIGGDDQIKVIKHLDAEVVGANPKPFFGLSDNTNLHNFLWNLGIVSYYGGVVMTDLGRPGSVNAHSQEAFRAAFFDDGWYDLRPAESFTDVNLDWADPANLERDLEMLPGAGWHWHGGSGAVEGRLWGGCLEIVDFNLRAARHLAPDDAAYDGCVLYLETSEEMPTAQYVGEVLMCMGERGLLQRFRALLMGRPKGWSFEHPNDQPGRQAYVDAQHEAVLAAMAEYSPDVPVVLDVDFGHTDPQLVIPNGGEVRIDPGREFISVRY